MLHDAGNGYISAIGIEKNETVEIGPGNLKFLIQEQRWIYRCNKAIFGMLQVREARINSLQVHIYFDQIHQLQILFQDRSLVTSAKQEMPSSNVISSGLPSLISKNTQVLITPWWRRGLASILLNQGSKQ